MSSLPRRELLAVCLAVTGVTAACGLGLAGGEDVGSPSGGYDSAGGGSATESTGSAGDATAGMGGGPSGTLATEDVRDGGAGGGAIPEGAGGGGGVVAGGGGVGGAAPEACSDHEDVFATVASVVVDDSNSFASPLLVRELVADPQRPPGAKLPVRPHEFLNYYASPLVGARLDLHEDGLRVGGDALLRAGEPSAEGPSLAEMVVTVTADDALADDVPDVTFVLDASMSMGGEGTDRLEGVVRGAADALAATQSVAVVTTNPAVGVVRPMAAWDDAVDPILVAARRLSEQADLGSSLEGALMLARDQASISGRPGVVVVVSDGSLSIQETTLHAVSEARGAGVRVVGVGVGPARGYADDVFDELTDRSGGAYWYAPDKATATEEVAQRFQQLTRIAARDVSLRVHLPDGITVAALSGGPGQQGSSVAAEGQNLGFGGTMPFHLVLAIEGPVPPCTGIGVQIVSTDGAGLQRTTPVEPAVFRLDEALAPGAPHGPALLRSSAVVAAAEALRGDRTVVRLERAAERLQIALKDTVDPADPLLGLCGQVLAVCAEHGDDASCAPCSPF